MLAAGEPKADCDEADQQRDGDRRLGRGRHSANQRVMMQPTATPAAVPAMMPASTRRPERQPALDQHRDQANVPAAPIAAPVKLTTATSR